MSSVHPLSSSSTALLYIYLISSFILSVVSLPFIVLHGISDACTNTGVAKFTERLANYSGAEGYCIEIGNGSFDSWFMPFMKQTEIACEKVKNIEELNDGYNIVALSQGNMVARGVIELCDGGPPVKLVCIVADYLMESVMYSTLVQDHFAPSNYIKIPIDIKGYLKGCKYLPMLNNEIEGARNSTYKERFASLENLILVMFEDDSVLVPKETSWFGSFPDGSLDTILPANETLLYTEDWIGLKTLDEAGRVKYVTVPGGHLEISDNSTKKYIVPFLEDKRSQQSAVISSSYSH